MLISVACVFSLLLHAEQLLLSGASVTGIDINESSIDNPSYSHFKASVTDESAIENIIKDAVSLS